MNLGICTSNKHWGRWWQWWWCVTVGVWIQFLLAKGYFSVSFRMCPETIDLFPQDQCANSRGIRFWALFCGTSSVQNVVNLCTAFTISIKIFKTHITPIIQCINTEPTTVTHHTSHISLKHHSMITHQTTKRIKNKNLWEVLLHNFALEMHFWFCRGFVGNCNNFKQQKYCFWGVGGA